jgi:hypothetical protein
MIREHSFNTRWWGAPVGIVTDAALLSRTPVADVAAATARFEWVELRASADADIDPTALAARGLFAVDTQIRFRVGLRRLASTSSVDRLDAHFADEQPFSVGAEDILPFGAERFSVLPGADEIRIRERYALWSRLLLDECPQRCLRVLSNGQVQGYFLSRQAEGGLNLTLAMLNPAATVTGMHLFHKALLAYAERGERIGHASFSVYNTPVMNIYANLGARFLSPEMFWFRLRE